MDPKRHVDVVSKRCSRDDVHQGEIAYGWCADPKICAPLSLHCLLCTHPGTHPNLWVRQEELVLPAIQLLLPALEPHFTSVDCQIPGGCSRRRHDILFLLDGFALAIELEIAMGTGSAAIGGGSSGKTMAARQLSSCSPTPATSAGR